MNPHLTNQMLTAGNQHNQHPLFHSTILLFNEANMAMSYSELTLSTNLSSQRAAFMFHKSVILLRQLYHIVPINAVWRPNWAAWMNWHNPGEFHSIATLDLNEPEGVFTLGVYLGPLYSPKATTFEECEQKCVALRYWLFSIHAWACLKRCLRTSGTVRRSCGCKHA